MSRKPIIGLTTYGKKENGEYRLPALYVESVRRAGGVAVLIPPDPEEAAAICERMDGIILTGGGDIDPKTYKGADHEQIYNIDEERDAGEFRVVETVLAQHIPTLAICRGIQILNVFLGGTLHEHLPETFGEDVLHRMPPRVACNHHVDILPDTRLDSIIGETAIEIVSWHHQSLKEIAEDLSVTARSRDGVIEGIEMASHPWLVGVQWHPELSAAEDPLQQRLFDALIERVRRK